MSRKPHTTVPRRSRMVDAERLPLLMLPKQTPEEIRRRNAIREEFHDLKAKIIRRRGAR